MDVVDVVDLVDGGPTLSTTSTKSTNLTARRSRSARRSSQAFPGDCARRESSGVWNAGVSPAFRFAAHSRLPCGVCRQNSGQLPRLMATRFPVTPSRLRCCRQLGCGAEAKPCQLHIKLGGDSRLGNFPADSDGRFGLTRNNSILILFLDFLQVLPESIKISTVFLDELLASSSRFLHDGIFPHAISYHELFRR